ncbi:MAG: MFS transporter, partial [Rhodothermales bacterium]
GDRIGRARTFAISLGLLGITMLATAWASDWTTVVLYRLMTGAGIGGTMVLSAILVAETWPERSRAIALATLGIAFPVGIVSSGLLTMAVDGWRSAFLFGGLPLGLALLSFAAVRDPRTWTPAAKPQPFRQLLGAETRRPFFIGVTVYGATLIGLWAAFSWLPTWAQSILPEGESGQRERGLLTMVLGLSGMLGTLVSGFLANAAGRRNTILASFAGCFVATFALFQTNAAFSTIVFAETAALGLFFGLSQGVLLVYIPELFPTRVRSTATGLCFNVGRLITAISVFFVGILVPFLGGYGNAVFAFAFMYVIAFVVAIFGPETKGKTLLTEE